MNVLRNISTFVFHAHGMLKASSKKSRPDIFQKKNQISSKLRLDIIYAQSLQE